MFDPRQLAEAQQTAAELAERDATIAKLTSDREKPRRTRRTPATSRSVLSHDKNQIRDKQEAF